MTCTSNVFGGILNPTLLQPPLSSVSKSRSWHLVASTSRITKTKLIFISFYLSILLLVNYDRINK